MSTTSRASPLDTLIGSLARLPGLGRRSAQRIALHLLSRREAVLEPLLEALAHAARAVKPCSVCGNLDGADPCGICTDAGRERGQICVVASPADLWAMEGAGAYRGLYHVTGGVLSALEGVGPEALNLDALAARAAGAQEVILALPATVDGMTTAHAIAATLAETGARVTRLGQGVPVGGELGRLDPGTIAAALRARGG
ncbi:MAG TPA: recombination protein RecR [Rhodospirillaceae bacterium]|jgi:recombination protein RecR|nr:recombination protein RecR [Alphaproteobacteria bacterium]HBH26420.1 recombination protein RecR [Rhodospirillaceae bacterium]